jgi:uncharacterized membrane protein YdfJ with MMPL/SSD domain
VEDINISGVDFGSNLPKWATDETLKKLYRIIQNDSNRDKKEQQKIISLLGKISSDIKTSSTTDKSILSELKAIKAIHKSNSNALSKLQTKNTSSSAQNNNKQLEKFLQNTNKTLQQINNNTAKAARIGGSQTSSNGSTSGNISSKKSNMGSEKVTSPLNSIGDKLKNKVGKGSFEDRVEESLSKKSKISAGFLCNTISLIN